MDNILYYGRFQPPHKGHASLIEYYYRTLKPCRIIVSMDCRPKDESNPYSFEQRKKELLALLPKEVREYTAIRHHKYRGFNHTSDKWLGAFYDELEEEVNFVIGGPDFETCKDAHDFWASKGANCFFVDERFHGLSSTQIREGKNAEKD